MSDTIINVFVSHHHKDDASVDGLASMLSGKSYQLRNSSIRAKPENQKRLDQKQVSDKIIERLLRRKMRWASQVIVIVGKETHMRPWVNWEIKVAHQLGKPIIGVYENGLKEKVEIPKNLEKYATSTHLVIHNYLNRMKIFFLKNPCIYNPLIQKDFFWRFF